MKKNLFLSLALSASLFLTSVTSVVNAQSTVKKAVNTRQVEKSYYTCPMHPQVKKDQAGKCPICGMALIEKKVQVKKTMKMQQMQDTARVKKHQMMENREKTPMKRDSMMKKGQMMKHQGVEKMKKDTAKMKRRIGM